MNRIKTCWLAWCLAAGMAPAGAQSDAVMVGLDWVPQHTSLRPHQRPSGGYFMLPAAELGFATNWLQPAQWLETTDAGTTIQTVALLSSLHESNGLQLAVQADVLGLGKAVGKSKQHFFSLGISEHVTGQVFLPGDLIRLPFLGNAGFEDGQVNGRGISAQLMHYRSYHLGWQTHASERLSAGVRLHHLRGFEYAALRNAGITWATDPDTWSWTVAGGAEVQTAGLAALWDTVEGNAAMEQGARAYLGLAGDPGWALDAGVSFRPSDRWSVEASVAGLGRIAWQREAWSASWEQEEMTFDGLALGAWALDPVALQDSLDHWADQTLAWADSASRPTTSDASFSTALPVRWNLRAVRELGKRTALHVALREGLTSAVTAQVGATIELGSTFQGHVTYQHSTGLRSLGVGFAAQLGPLQWFTVVDNVLAAQLVAVELPEDRTLYLPYDASRLQARVGLNWMFGRKRKTDPLPAGATWEPSSQRPGGQFTRKCPSF